MPRTKGGILKGSYDDKGKEEEHYDSEDSSSSGGELSSSGRSDSEPSFRNTAIRTVEEHLFNDSADPSYSGELSSASSHLRSFSGSPLQSPLQSSLQSSLEPSIQASSKKKKRRSRYDPQLAATSKKRTGGSRQRKRARPVTAARPSFVEVQVSHLQSTTDLLIHRLQFAREVKEISDRYGGFDEYNQRRLVWEEEALVALQTAAEDYLVHLFMDSQMAAQHASRKTLKTDDVTLVRKLRGPEKEGLF